MKMYSAISEKACKNSPDGNWNIIRSHNMRRYFNSALLNAGCDSFHVEFFMGHKQDETRAGYFRASPEKLREIYLKYVPFLTIKKEEDITENPLFKERESYRQALEAQLAKSTIENSQLQDMKDRLKQSEEANEKFKEDLFKQLQEYSITGIGQQSWTFDENGNPKKADPKDFKTT
jgi:hypothetical protein